LGATIARRSAPADERLNDYLARLDASGIEDGASAGGARTKISASHLGQRSLHR